jgi:DNA-binding LacI/PurR family transcriptional regulator
VTARLSAIAARAGVSEATVSRVLNGRPGVSPATREVVVAAMDALGFERQLRLRERGVGLVGVITPELTNPIFPALAQVIEQVLTSRGYTPLLCTRTPGGSTEDQLVELLVDRGVAGIIFVSGQHADTAADTDRYVKLAGQGVPFVMINGYTAKVSAPFVSTDDRAAMRLAVAHLAALGHERIGLAVGPERFVPVLRKVEGFREVAPDGLIQHTLFTVEGGQAAAVTLLDKGCTAIVCGNDLMALGAVRAARDRGLSVPADVSVVGFDDSLLIAFTDPPLTTLRQPVEAMGQAAVNALFEELAGTPAPHVEYVFQPELVVRGSTTARGQHL